MFSTSLTLDYQLREHQRIGGFRTMLGVPMYEKKIASPECFSSADARWRRSRTSRSIW